MTKEEKIKDEWVAIYGEEKYNLIKYAISENGYIYSTRFPEISKIIDTTKKGIQWGMTIYSPINLKGISDNNGWIKIESEDDLPKETDTYHFISRHNGKLMKDYFISDSKVMGFKNCQLKFYSHYQPIVKPKPPIY